ncbi:glycosyltransferase family 4 protein [Thermosynechococcus sichuanensis E542]|uniref:Glycosyltransferase family 4 protein n=1 Tax=Thermosynechococcus sichuanensis E542 TaxID=2016101 RepID=A0A3B7MGG8_9CYAN|nr:glycosyltransferase family 4 protein [Thermosynechococcus vestitus]AXY68625.1 glycosyltransferase family 4 protein [Thermosynechococcus vestitus E542]
MLLRGYPIACILLSSMEIKNHYKTSKLSGLSLILLCNNAKMLINFRSDLILDLIHAGTKVYCLAPDYTETEILKLSEMGAICHHFYLVRNSTNPWQEIKSFFSIITIIKQINADSLLAITSKPIIWGLLAAASIRVPYRFALFTGLGYAFTPTNSLKQKILKGILGFLYRLSLPVATKVIFQNSDDASEIINICKLPSKKATIIKGTGVSLKEWTYLPPHVEPITFTFVGRLLKEKGVLEFLQAAKEIRSQYPSIRFWLLGQFDTNPGSLPEAQIKKIIELGIVEWFGFANVKEYLGSTSVFVLPSYREGVPRSTQEAMAMGRPVITTDVPGCRETVIGGYNGYLIPPRDVDALITAMHKFIEQPSLIPLMGYHSYQMAVELFDVKKINAQYIKLFHGC